MEPFGLSDEALSKIRTVFANHSEIESVILYGSRSRGSFQTFSDIDLTLIGENLNNNVITHLIFEMDDLLLPYTFDISIFSTINSPDLRDQILREGVRIYGR